MSHCLQKLAPNTLGPLSFGTTMIVHRSVAMKQLLSDFAAMAQPGYWSALGLLVILMEWACFSL
jgi:hypothetical protein